MNQSHSAIWPVKAGGSPAPIKSPTNSTVTSTATTSVTKITGLRMSWRGSSLITASRSAGSRMAGLRTEIDFVLVDMKSGP
ncbi:hypothetical protein FQZ97_1249360 [compost metagenome]